MARRRQKGKHCKRSRAWHRGKAEGRRAIRALKKWPDTGIEVPPSGAPVPVRRGPGNQDRGESA